MRLFRRCPPGTPGVPPEEEGKACCVDDDGEEEVLGPGEEDDTTPNDAEVEGEEAAEPKFVKKQASKEKA